MAKLYGPLLSESAHGKFAQSLIYSRRKEGNIGRSFHMPNKEITLKQWTQRHIIGLLTAHWQVKSDAEKLVYEDLSKASGLNISGFNYFIKVAQADLYAHHGLCGYWSMNEATGAQVLDYSGQGNHGTLYPSYPSNCPTRVTAMLKQYGNALGFDGIDEYANAGSSSIFNFTSHNFTLEAWINPQSTPAAKQIFGRSAWQANGWRFGVGLGSNLSFYTFQAAANQATSAVAAVTVGKWYHVIMVRQGAAAKIYVNAIDKTTSPGTHIDPATRTGNLFLGSGSATVEFYFGLLDEMRIYNRALSRDEILKHYNLLRLDKKRQPLLIH